MLPEAVQPLPCLYALLARLGARPAPRPVFDSRYPLQNITQQQCQTACPPVQGERVWTALRYDARSATEIRSRLRLRSTTPGANNRLDIQAIISWDREDGAALPMMGARGAVAGGVARFAGCILAG